MPRQPRSDREASGQLLAAVVEQVLVLHAQILGTQDCGGGIDPRWNRMLKSSQRPVHVSAAPGCWVRDRSQLLRTVQSHAISVRFTTRFSEVSNDGGGARRVDRSGARKKTPTA